ncbi:chitinase-like protein EN03 [Bacillus rossius redtenbacheri]|uniref:chitinase-like protein EN03 n=1 Tax=Bacillus rossius redtenbacheri TaxID=93214 RepID=UPI002FDCA30C
MHLCWLALGAAILLAAAPTGSRAARVLCYYDSRAYWRQGSAKYVVSDIESSLTYCTHVLYGYAKIDSTNSQLTPLDDYLDVDTGKGNYRAATALRRRYFGIKLLLSVGGGADTENREKYLTLLENSDTRTAFINSAKMLVKQNGFDGLDLAWQFPETNVKKQRSTLGSIWHSIKQTLGYGRDYVDEKQAEHRSGFTALVRDLKAALRPDNLLLTVAVLPNVNASTYLDAPEVSQHLDTISLMAYDYKTPERNKKQADYPAPLYTAGGRDANQTVDGAVTWWLQQGVPASKLSLGIPMFGRTWKLTADSAPSGVPPLDADGPGAEGSLTTTPGLLAYPEVCALIPNPNQRVTGSLLRKVSDPSQKLGTYAFRLPDPETEEGGLWVGYEDPDTAGNKATYARHKGLGGITAADITLDDFKGVCSGYKYPVLKAAKERL